MTCMEFFGCAFIAYGPALAMFVFTISQDPIRIIILIASAFFWLLSLLISSLIWLCWPFKSTLFFGVTCSVLFQELFRHFLYTVLHKAEEGLKKVSMPNTQITNNNCSLAYVAGLGFGIMSGAFSLVNILAGVAGPGTMGLKGGSANFCTISAVYTMLFIFLHVFWGIIFFEAKLNNNSSLFVYVITTHLLASYLTMFNASSLFWIALTLVFSITVFSGGIAFSVCGGTIRSLTILFSKDRQSCETC